MLVEQCQPGNSLDDIALLVHDDDSGRSQTRLSGYQGVKVHQDVIANPVNDKNQDWGREKILQSRTFWGSKVWMNRQG